MKKFLLLALMMVGISASAQFSEEAPTIDTEIGRSGQYAMLVKYDKGGDKWVTLYFKNLKYSTIFDLESIQLIDMDGVDAFYNILVESLDKRQNGTEDFERVLKLDNGDKLTLAFTKYGKYAKVSFTTWDGVSLKYSLPFGLKQVNKIFNR